MPITKLSNMKKAFIIICLFTISFTDSFSQIKAGLKAGLNFCNVKFPEPSDTKTRVAFYGGVQAEIAVGKKFILQPELLYSQKGFRYYSLGTSQEGHISINYISVPLLAEYSLTDKLKVSTGPEFNYLVNAKSRDNGVSNDLSKNYKKFDVAIDLGVSYQFLKSFGINFRYSYGLTYLVEGVIMDPVGNQIGTINLGKNRALQAGMFYIF